MQVILINPPFNLGVNKDSKEGKYTAVLPPLGLLYVAAVMKKEGNKVEVWDCDVEGIDYHKLIERLQDLRPEYVGFYTNSANIDMVLSICLNIKPFVKRIVLGGPEITLHPEKGKNYEVFKGQIDDINKLPFPARELINLDKYQPSPHHYIKSPSTTMITSIGCPYNCSYCYSSQLYKRKYQQRTVDNVIEEIKHLKKWYGIKEIQFWDDLFGLNRKWLIEFCEKVKELDIVWVCEMRANLVEPIILALMKEAGCYSIFYGCESFNQDILDLVNKQLTVKQIKDAIIWTNMVGIMVRANFILGLPLDTPENAKKEIDEICKLPIDYIKWNLFCPYEGTEIYKGIEKYGKLTDAIKTNHEVSFIPNGYKDADELEQMRQYAFRKFYYRPIYIWKKIKEIRNPLTLKRYLRGLKLLLVRY